MQEAQLKDKALVISLLCEAFDTNPSVNYVVKQDRRRKQRIRSLMHYSWNICRKYGKVYLADNRKACALIVFPDKKKPSLWTMFLDVKLMFSSIGIKKLPLILERDKKIKSNYPNSKVYALWYIGVYQKEQGKGYGSSLLSELLQDAKSKGRNVYIETSVTANVKLYEKYGFQLYGELKLDHELFLLRKEW